MKKLYWKFFPIIQPLVYLIPQKTRYGGNEYLRTFDFISRTEYLDNEQRYNLQVSLLKNLLIHAYETTPYWKKLFDRIKFSPYQFSELYHIQKIPLMTKSVLKENFNDLISRNFSKFNSHVDHTGGTTGTPVSILVENKARAREWAFMHNQWFRMGYKVTDKKLVLRGHRSFGGKILYNRWYNEYIVSPYDSINFEMIIETIKRKKITVIHGYPSRIQELAVYLNNKNQTLEEIKLVLCGSEALLPWQKEAMKKGFPRARIYSWYGHTEKLVLGGNCEVNSEDYHLFYQYGLTEVLKDDGKVDFEGKGEIVGTGFINYAMPLIRYRTGDVGHIRKVRCECGRNYDLLKITEGRLHEHVVDKFGNKLTLTAVVFGAHVSELAKVDCFQLYQNKPGEVILKYVSSIKTDEELLAKELQEACNNVLRIIPKKVDNIERTGANKHKYIIQELEEK